MLLLDMDIYIGIVRGCCGTPDDMSSVISLYTSALFERDQARYDIPASHAVPGTPDSCDRHAVERLSSAGARRSLTSGSPPTLPLRLQAITTQTAYMDFLKALVSDSGYTLRKIEQETRHHFPHAPVSKSTLHDALKRSTVPTQEPGLRSVLTVLYMRLNRRERTDPVVVEQVENALQVWRQVQLPPPQDAVSAAGANLCSPKSPSCYPLIEMILRVLERAEESARRVGSADATGLAHAQLIVREMAG
ncbi:hypothetical protein [Amycolatopsis sp. cg9]|uniref:hypothetical protein n=1 Tax=Amycolatopsis sp. cg9 TaxID=3238801 RepID=UPI00352322AA